MAQYCKKSLLPPIPTSKNPLAYGTLGGVSSNASMDALTLPPPPIMLPIPFDYDSLFGWMVKICPSYNNAASAKTDLLIIT
jgi:hypothetical protein